MEHLEINSKEYWDFRFSTNWESNNGRLQTRYFTKLAIELFPESFKKIIYSNKLSILDWGCAEGDGTALLAEEFKSSNVIGLDFSQIAIEKAKKNYPKNNFICGTLQECNQPYDLIYTSNCLEHFNDPKQLIKELLNYTNHFLVLLLPFQETKRIEEHLYSFDFNFFDFRIEDSLLVFHREVNSLPTYWSGKQILLIYIKSDSEFLHQINLEFYKDFNLAQKEETIIILEEQAQNLQHEVQKLNNEVIQKANIIIKLQDKVIQNNETIHKLLNEKEKKDAIILELQNKTEKYRKIIDSLNNEINLKNNQLNMIYSTKSWRLAAKYWKLKQGLRKLGREYLPEPVKAVIKKFYNPSKVSQDEITERKKELKSILKMHPEAKGVIIYPPTIDWHHNLFQRPQQLALAFAKKGYLFLYCTENFSADSVYGFEKLKDNLFLCNVPFEVFEIVDSPILLISWTVNRKYIKYFEKPIIIYDYIDDLKVFDQYNEEMERAHQDMIRRSDIVMATASKLYYEVKEVRNDCIYNPNAVDYEFFQKAKDRSKINIPDDIKGLINGPVIGYYGAMANWFDYELVKYCADKRPQYNFILIGLNYDDSISTAGLENYTNIYWLGPKKYEELPNYLGYFDVATIPFKINEITEATSPVKLFEYMAGGRPIVTTAMPECKKYRSVLASENYEEYLNNLDRALSLGNDEEYLKLMEKEALENTWENRVEKIIEAIEGKVNGH